MPSLDDCHGSHERYQMGAHHHKQLSQAKSSVSSTRNFNRMRNIIDGSATHIRHKWKGVLKRFINRGGKESLVRYGSVKSSQVRMQSKERRLLYSVGPAPCTVYAICVEARFARIFEKAVHWFAGNQLNLAFME
nr:hypothetical protein Iba_chr13bCG6900 [Ipomoea batatas]